MKTLLYKSNARQFRLFFQHVFKKNFKTSCFQNHNMVILQSNGSTSMLLRFWLTHRLKKAGSMCQLFIRWSLKFGFHLSAKVFYL